MSFFSNYSTVFFSVQNQLILKTKHFFHGSFIVVFLTALSGSLFSQTSYSFTNAGITGSVGPTQLQLNAAYASTNLSGSVSVLGFGIQQFTVPISGMYHIVAAGSAAGGSINSFGCRGRIVEGDVLLNAGQVLKILVGQKGLSGSTSTGGGGGSYVATNTNSLLIVGAGGGGYCTVLTSAAPASDGSYGNNGQNYTGTTGGGTGGTGGGGGNGAPSGWGGGGGGFTGNGTTASACAGTGGLSFINGGTGGGTCFNSVGGFGGGGGTHGNTGGGGGGGGYSGGGGSEQTPSTSSGGGGGSYQSPNMINLINGGLNIGPGYVTLIRLTGISISQIAPVSCNGLSNAALAVTYFGGTPPYTYTWFPGGSNSTTLVGCSAGAYTCVAQDAASTTYTATFTVTEPAVLTATVGQTNVVCNNGTTGSFTTIPIGGTAPYSYTWFPNGGNSAIASGLTAGAYTCTIKDANNCITVQTRTLTQPAPLNLVAFATNTLVCMGSSVTLIGSGALTYTWTNGAVNGVPFAPVVTSSYVLTATNASGCSGSAFTTVSVIPSPTLSVSGTTAVCALSQAVFTVTGANSYTWSTAATGSVVNVTPSVSTVYTVYGTGSNGCVVSATKSLTALVLPVVLANASSSIVCIGNSVVLSGSGANTYTWSSGVSNGLAFNPTITTNYTVSGTDLNGCVNTATRSVVVNPLPNVTINASATVCAGSTLLLTAGGATTYTWNTNATTATVNVSPQTSTVYSVSGTDINACVNSATHTLTVMAIPVITVNSSSNGTLCSGSTLTLAASGALTYTWLPGNLVNQSATFIPTASTIYSVSGTNSLGCNASTTVSTTVIPRPLISLNTPPALCLGDSTVLTASGAQNYIWQPVNVSAQSITITPGSNTVYTVVGTSSLGCSNSATVQIIIKPLPSIQLSSTHSVVCVDESATLTASGALSYTWSTLVNTATLVITPTANTIYTISGTGSNSCSATFTFEQIVSACTGQSTLSFIDTEPISIYPNPTTGEFLIKGISNTDLMITNEFGQLIKSIELDQKEQHSISLTELMQGIYFIQATSNAKTYRTKLLLVR